MKIKSIQVIPIIEAPDGDVTPQPEGPTEATTAWGIYERLEDGTVQWAGDAVSENHAMKFGAALTVFHNVQIETQVWVKKRYNIAWFIDVWAHDHESAARVALRMQRDLNSTATVFSVVGPDGVAAEIDLSTIDENKGAPA